MSNYAKTGGKPGKPGYRTSDRFIFRKYAQVQSRKSNAAMRASGMKNGKKK